MLVVVRLGGSVIASPVNPSLINEYIKTLKKLGRMRHQIVIVVGGGSLARDLIATGKRIGIGEASQDRLAISVSRLYAQLFQEKLGRLGCGKVPITIEEAAACIHEHRIVVMGGLKPGMTTDTVAALLAEETKADLMVKLTDQEGVYDRDPKTYKDAAKLDSIAFDELGKVLSQTKHKAGIHQILDPEAMKILTRNPVKLVVASGFKPENLIAAIRGESVGTVIE